MLKKNFCPNTYFSRELSGYIGLLVSADGLLSSVEKNYGVDDAKALQASQELDAVIAKVMTKRAVVSDILLADLTFSL